MLSTTDPATAENDPTLDVRTNIQGSTALLPPRADCRNILSHGGAFTPEGTDLLYELKETCKQRNISPGGAADLLSAALFLHRLEKTFR